MNITSSKPRQSASNNEALRLIKQIANKPIYAGCLMRANGGGDGETVEAYLARLGMPSTVETMKAFLRNIKH